MSMLTTDSLQSRIQTWIHTSIAEAIGLALAHFVWEGLAIAVLLGIALWLARGASARLRYALACVALAALPVAFSVTLAILMPSHSGSRVILPMPPPESSSLDFTAIAGSPEPWRFADRVAWAAPFWITGVLFLFVYRSASWITAERLRRRGVCAVSDGWSRRFEALVARVGISRAVRLLESGLVNVPMVIGYLRPVVLVPMGMLAGLPADQVEAILLHELAHIWRADYLVNLLQSAIESVLFYHPAVWWISSVVRAERENCCDDFVIARETDPRAYAAALLAIEQERSGQLTGMTAVAANGGNLLRRVRRMLRKPAAHEGNAAIVPVALAILGAGVALAAWQPDIVMSTIVTPNVAKSNIVKPGVVKPDVATSIGSAAASVAPTTPIVPAGKAQNTTGAPFLTKDRPLFTKDQMLVAQASQTGQAARGGRGAVGNAPEQTWPLVTDQIQSAPADNTPYSKWVNEDAAYIITNQERDEWKKLATDEQREQFIKDFWERRNPTPGSSTNPYKEEHYRRIAVANTRFKAGISGWKTDRGRMYITYGPPDEMESHPSGGSYTRPAEQGGGTTNTYPFEKWRYRFIEGMGNNIIVEFVDTAMNGEYRLSTDPSTKEKLLSSSQPQPLQVVQGVPSGPSGRGFGDKHAGVLIYSEGQVTLVIPLEGPGLNHIYARLKTADGEVVTYWEQDANPANLNFVRNVVLKPGSYVFSAARSGRDGETEVVNFTVK
jgi:GWxTD domain-containing protein